MQPDSLIGGIALYELVSRVAEFIFWLVAIRFFWHGMLLFKRYRELLDSMRTCERCGREVLNRTASHCGRCGQQLQNAA